LQFRERRSIAALYVHGYNAPISLLRISLCTFLVWCWYGFGKNKSLGPYLGKLQGLGKLVSIPDDPIHPSYGKNLISCLQLCMERLRFGKRCQCLSAIHFYLERNLELKKSCLITFLLSRKKIYSANLLSPPCVSSIWYC
jgi:hypothetical protein